MSAKWIGILLAALGCIALGFALAIALGKRAKALDELTQALTLIMGRVTMRNQPLDQAIWELAGESPILSAAAAIQGPPHIAWEQALKAMPGLHAQDRKAAADIIKKSAGASMQEQQGIYQAGLQQMQARLAQAKAQAAGDAKLYRTLGLLAAAAVAVLAI